MAFSAIAASLAQAATQAASVPVPPTPQNTNTRNAVNVAPVGVNLGAILEPMRQGSVTNGGADLQLPAPNFGYPLQPVGSLVQGPTRNTQGNVEVNPIVVLAFAAGGVALLMLLR